MDETRFLSETLGFEIDERGNFVYEGQPLRTATLTEIAMWDLLKTPQSQWDAFLPPTANEMQYAGTLF